MRNPACMRSNESGSTTIEVAILFSLFFSVVYAAVSYSVPFVLSLTYQALSAEAARAAVRVDQSLPTILYAQKVNEQIEAVINASWLPQSWLGDRCRPPSDGLGWTPLPGNPSHGYLAKQEVIENRPRYFVHVCIERKYNKDGNEKDRAILPVLRLGSFSIPALPTNSDGDAILHGSSTLAL